MSLEQSRLESLPKVELHVHLEGTVTAETAIALAKRHGEDPRAVLPLVDGDYPKRFSTFQEFVDLYLAVSRQIRTPDDLATVAAAFAAGQAAQNVRYTEVTFTAMTHVRNGMALKEMWRALRDGFSEAPGCDIRLIIDARRDLGTVDGHDTVRVVADADAPIAGFGLTGVEGSLPESEFGMLRDAADTMGLGLAVHAGETGGPSHVAATLDDLGADRIGHGVRSIEDEELVRRLVRDGTPLEICPSSNVALKIFPSLEEHPFPSLWSAGANVTVNSDDPPFFSTTLTVDLAHAVRLAALDESDVAELQRRAARSAFLDESSKQRLIRSIDDWESGAQA